MRRMTVAAAGLAALALAACSSGGDDDDSLPQRSFVEMGDQFSDLQGDINGLPLTDPATLPTSGSAGYDGVMNVQTTTGLLARGDVEVEVDFGDPADAVDGEAYNFRTDLDAEVDGSLRIDGSLDRDVDITVEAPLTIDVEGTLTADGTSHEIDATDGPGFLYGTEPGFIAGAAIGTVNSGGVIGTADIYFIGER